MVFFLRSEPDFFLIGAICNFENRWWRFPILNLINIWSSRLSWENINVTITTNTFHFEGIAADRNSIGYWYGIWGFGHFTVCRLQIFRAAGSTRTSKSMPLQFYLYLFASDRDFCYSTLEHEPRRPTSLQAGSWTIHTILNQEQRVHNKFQHMPREKQFKHQWPQKNIGDLLFSRDAGATANVFLAPVALEHPSIPSSAFWISNQFQISTIKNI